MKKHSKQHSPLVLFIGRSTGAQYALADNNLDVKYIIND
jgi:hypothetical protein